MNETIDYGEFVRRFGELKRRLVRDLFVLTIGGAIGILGLLFLPQPYGDAAFVVGFVTMVSPLIDKMEV